MAMSVWTNYQYSLHSDAKKYIFFIGLIYILFETNLIFQKCSNAFFVVYELSKCLDSLLKYFPDKLFWKFVTQINQFFFYKTPQTRQLLMNYLMHVFICIVNITPKRCRICKYFKFIRRGFGNSYSLMKIGEICSD